MAKYIKTEDGYRTINYIGLATDAMVQEVADSKMDVNNPTGTGSFSMNRKPNTAVGFYSHAEGFDTSASGVCSHAEGNNTSASGNHSHAEGFATSASGNHSHAEGYAASASGDHSHAEGSNTFTPGCYSHAEGYYTTAQKKSQHVQGEFNILDTKGANVNSKGKYAHIVGNGTSSTNRSNAHTLDWNGVGWFQGGLQVGGNAQDDGAKNVLLDGDAVPVPATATVGQTIVVKSVDENGKPTAWEAVDPWIIQSSTEGSTKKFKITIDDSGTITSTEII